MQNGLAQERQAAMSALGGAPGAGGPAGLTPGQGPPPPTGMGGQYPAGAAAPQQMQPTPGFEQLASQMLQILVQGNEADLQIFGQMIGQLQSLAESRAPQQPVAGAAPQAPTIP